MPKRCRRIRTTFLAEYCSAVQKANKRCEMCVMGALAFLDYKPFKTDSLLRYVRPRLSRISRFALQYEGRPPHPFNSHFRPTAKDKQKVAPAELCWLWNAVCGAEEVLLHINIFQMSVTLEGIAVQISQPLLPIFASKKPKRVYVHGVFDHV